MRQITNVDGKKQKTCYFCSETCKRASYKHLFDGKAAERKAEYDRNRDRRESARRYYAAHAERERARAKERYWADPEAARANMAFQRRKRKVTGVTPAELVEEEV